MLRKEVSLTRASVVQQKAQLIMSLTRIWEGATGMKLGWPRVLKTGCGFDQRLEMH